VSDPRLRVLLDAGVPTAVGLAFREAGHEPLFYNDVLPEKVPDDVVAATAIANDAILVAQDNDMKRLAKRYGEAPQSARFARLHLIRLCCSAPQAANRTRHAMSLIQHEWAFTRAKSARRLWIDIGSHFIRSHR
jgi:predicted nuclease of predicted toxin-antitoxin system